MNKNSVFFTPFCPSKFEPIEIDFIETGINPFSTTLTLMKYEEVLFDYT